MDRIGTACPPEGARAILRRADLPLYVACSGGADSVAALLWTYGYLSVERVSRSLVCLHFNHGLRGHESDEDERFVLELAAALNIESRSEVASWAEASGRISEDALRRARLEFFARTAQAPGAVVRQAIVTGHHADDVAETMLMRLSRGSGTDGLAAPRPVSKASGNLLFVRPLLSCRRLELREALQAVGASWREDSSNEGHDFYRNRLRSKVIPAWKSACVDRPLTGGILRSREMLEEDASALTDWADRVWKEVSHPDGSSLRRSVLLALPKALRRRLLQRLVLATAPKLRFPSGIADQALARLEVAEDWSFDLSPDWRLRGDGDWALLESLHVAKRGAWSGFALPHGCCAYLPDGARVASSAVEAIDGTAVASEGPLGRDRRWAVVADDAKQRAWLWVRPRKKGDVYRPHGKESPRKLSKLQIERKIEVERRESLPLFVDPDGEIVWAPGLPPSAERLLDPGSRSALRLTYAT